MQVNFNTNKSNNQNFGMSLVISPRANTKILSSGLRTQKQIAKLAKKYDKLPGTQYLDYSTNATILTPSGETRKANPFWLLNDYETGLSTIVAKDSWFFKAPVKALRNLLKDIQTRSKIVKDINSHTSSSSIM